MELNKFNTQYNSSVNNTFTKDQSEAISGIIDFIAAPFDIAKYIVGLSGAAGTGKTYITKYIISHCKYSSSVIKCTSPTHKACRVFSQAINNSKVETIQSTFGLRLDLKLEDFNPIRPQFNPNSAPKLQGIKLLLIDEASMLPAKLVTYICNKCKELQIKILMIGDSYQLSPVNEKKSIAFNRCYKVYNLTQIVRQEHDNPIKDLLSMLRDDITNKSSKFIGYIYKNINNDFYNEIGEGYTICDRQEFKKMIDLSFSDKEYTSNIDMYRIIAYTNTCVSGWNNYIRSTIIPNADKNIITKNDLIMSYETIVNEFMEVVINNSEEYIINDIVNFTDTDFGFKGYLVKFQLVHGGNITSPLFILDHRDNYTIMKYYKVINSLIENGKSSNEGTRVARWKEYYAFKKKYILAANILNKFGKTLFERDIDYGFAITAHKSQGSTYDIVFVDLNDMIYDRFGHPYTNYDDLLRRLYVACSRAHKRLILCYGN